MNVKNIGLFGRCNVGKSSLINTLAGQEVAIVNSLAGTTADPVAKRMEIFGLGACRLIDTAGLDDMAGELGNQKVTKSLKVASEVDLALILFSANKFEKPELSLLQEVIKNGTPYILVHNQADIIPLQPSVKEAITAKYKAELIDFSCCYLDAKEQEKKTKELISLIKSELLKAEEKQPKKNLLEGLVNEGDTVVFVCPIDSEAPKERLILPQVMAIRAALDKKAIAIAVQPSELKEALKKGNVALVVTDSQAVKEVRGIVPKNIKLTSFSILLARQKGPFQEYEKGVEAIDRLKEHDKVLILESCSHRATCEDIGRVKMPRLLQEYCGCSLDFTFISGQDTIPEGAWRLVIQCGGCMVTDKILNSRISSFIAKKIPVTNYGLALFRICLRKKQ